MPQTEDGKGVSSNVHGKNGEGFSALLTALMGNMENIQDVEVIEILEDLEGEEVAEELPFPVAIPFNLMNFQNQNNETSIEVNLTQPEGIAQVQEQTEVQMLNLVEEEGQMTTIIPKEEVAPREEMVPKEEPKVSFEQKLQVEGEKIEKIPPEAVKPQLEEQPEKVKITKEEKSEPFKTELFHLQPETKEVQDTEPKSPMKPIEPTAAKENIQRLNDSIIKLIETTTVDNKSVMKVKLYPEELGTLDLTLEMQEGKLIAKIMVDNESVKQLFSDKLGELNQNLVKQNINIQDFKVEVKPEASLDFNSNGEFSQENREQPKASRILGHKEIMLEETPIEMANTSGELSILA